MPGNDTARHEARRGDQGPASAPRPLLHGLTDRHNRQDAPLPPCPVIVPDTRVRLVLSHPSASGLRIGEGVLPLRERFLQSKTMRTFVSSLWWVGVTPGADDCEVGNRRKRRHWNDGKTTNLVVFSAGPSSPQPQRTRVVMCRKGTVLPTSGIVRKYQATRKIGCCSG